MNGSTDEGPENKPLSFQDTYKAKGCEFYGVSRGRRDEVGCLYSK